MFDIRSETDNSVSENVQESVKDPKELELDVTDAIELGPCGPRSNHPIPEFHNDQSTASNRDILEVESQSQRRSSLVSTQQQIPGSGRPVHVLDHSENGKI